MHVVRQAKRGFDVFPEVQVQRGERATKAQGAAGKQDVLHGGEDRGAGVPRARRARHDPDWRLVDVVGEVFSRNQHAGELFGRLAWRRRGGPIARADDLMPGLAVPGAGGSLDGWIADHQEAPGLHVAAIGRAGSGV